MSASEPIVAHISQEGFAALDQDLDTVIAALDTCISDLAHVANIARTLAAIGHGDTSELICSAIAGIRGAKADLTEAQSLVKSI